MARRTTSRGLWGQRRWLSATLDVEVDNRIWVDARSDIFDASDDSPSRGGLLPVQVSLLGGSGRYIEFPSVLGTSQAGIGWPEVGADGGNLPNVGGTNIFSADGISGIEHNRFLFMTGVFLNDTSPTLMQEPPRLDFADIGSNFSELSPALAQSFFIGDGRTDLGGLQRFYIPDDATRLFLGFADAYVFGWPNGLPPGAYADNTGGLRVEFNVGVVPEPSSLAVWSLLGMTHIAAGWRLRRRRRQGGLPLPPPPPPPPPRPCPLRQAHSGTSCFIAGNEPSRTWLNEPNLSGR